MLGTNKIARRAVVRQQVGIGRSKTKVTPLALLCRVGQGLGMKLGNDLRLWNNMKIAWKKSNMGGKCAWLPGAVLWLAAQARTWSPRHSCWSCQQPCRDCKWASVTVPTQSVRGCLQLIHTLGTGIDWLSSSWTNGSRWNQHNFLHVAASSNACSKFQLLQLSLPPLFFPLLHSKILSCQCFPLRFYSTSPSDFISWCSNCLRLRKRLP